MEGMAIAVALIIILTTFCMLITFCWAVWRTYKGEWRYRGGRLRCRSLNGSHLPEGIPINVHNVTEFGIRSNNPLPDVGAMPARSPINVHNVAQFGMGPSDPLPVGFKGVQADPLEVLRIPPPYPKHMPYIPNTAAAPHSEASMRAAEASLVPTAPPASPDYQCPQNDVAAPPYPVATPPYPVATPPYPMAGPPYPVASSDERQHEPYLPEVLPPAPPMGWLASSTPTTKGLGPRHVET